MLATKRRVTILPLPRGPALKRQHCQAGMHICVMGPSTIFCTHSPPSAVCLKGNVSLPTDHHYGWRDSEWTSAAKQGQEVFSPFRRVISELDAHSLLLCQFWHRRGGSEPQTRVGTSKASFSTKAFAVELPTMC